MLIALLGLVAPHRAMAQACDTGLDADCDADGYSLGEGDCDDDNAAVNPGGREDCTDRLDNNCDGFFNEECDRDAYNGTIGGGGGCTSENAIGNEAAMFFVLPLLAFGARRREARR